MVSIVRRFVSFVRYFFSDLLTRFDVVVTPENVISNGKIMAVHLVFILFFTLYGCIFLELEATGTVDWPNLWTSPYLYTQQLIQAEFRQQINQLVIVCTTLEVFAFLSYIFVQPIKREFLLIKTDENTVTIDGKALLFDSTATQILAFRKRYKKILISTVAIVTFLSLIWYYINVYLSGRYIISFHCLLFFWTLQFPFEVGYFYYGNFFLIFLQNTKLSLF